LIPSVARCVICGVDMITEPTHGNRNDKSHLSTRY
jgi:hypothetical protein